MEKLPLGAWASPPRAELLKLLDQLQASITPLEQAVKKAAEPNPAALRLMEQPGLGPVEESYGEHK